ncbi:O-antigen polymerase [Ornithinibacillus halotolerans]|uniref:Oligosaccharide repeat unit polymerase n=1 Tax=Ornithinibacillus halotolerans TaxID=1274357 RepID=A0A916RQC1_9BACI|nr:O-antigen polymerase [Ornithinibacillus halotolerans]GGA65147.1 hypothetical protein GCM10008025_06220 [Ornithinibacillus halotolerans]
MSISTNNGNTLTLKKLTIILMDLALINLYIYCLLAFFQILPALSNFNVTLLSIISITIAMIIFFNSGRRNGLSLALLAYTIVTQFGISTIYYLLGPEYLTSFSNTTLSFLTSPQYNKAILLGIIGVISYVYGTRIAQYLNRGTVNKVNENKNENNVVFFAGLMMLFLVFLYLSYYLATGRIYFGMSYHSYINSGIMNGLYSWILLMYAAGISFVVAVGDKKQIQIGFFVFILSAFIFFSTGNRGEVLYAVLGVLGILYYKTGRIKLKYIVVVFFILFILIPFIRVARHSGTISSLDMLSVDLINPFAEMGVQLRLSVLILEEFAYGIREMLYGFSYYSPIINILDNVFPGNIRLNMPDDFNFIERFEGFGFSQIAESYANFGLIGVVIFYVLLGFIIRKAECKQLSGISLAFWGGILAVLINATRNRFAFVPGQVLILFIVVFIILFITRSRVTRSKSQNAK